MRRSEPSSRGVIVSLIAAVVLLPLAIAGPAAAATCTSTLTGVNIPALPVLIDNHLNGVAARTPTDLWAVGGRNAKSTLILHSDGTSWTVAANPGTAKTGDLFGVAAFSATDAWAVGENVGYSPYPLFQHWDGTQWSYGALGKKGALRGVDGSSGADVWAVGYTIGSTYTTLYPEAQHFDGSTWTSVPTAGDAPLGTLNGVSAVSSSNVWAVGDSPDGALLQRWNGSVWSSSSEPTGDATAKLMGVSAVSSSNVWAVGGIGSGSASSLIEHWNGTAWSVISSPSPGSQSNLLTSVSARAANDVWAAGSSTSGGIRRTLLLHWNGSSWRRVDGSAVPQDSGFGGVATAGTNKAVAVGDTIDGTSGIDRTLVAGSSLSTASVESSPNIDRTSRPLFRGVDVGSDTDAWAVGTNGQPVAEHWDGTGWTATTVPSAAGEVEDVQIISPNDVWAVGSAIPHNGSFQPRIMHWDGTSWTIVPSHITGYADLHAIDAVSPSDIWAVGDIGDRPLVDHWDGSSWRRVSSPLFVSGTSLQGVLAAGPHNVLVVGPSSMSPVLRWDGTSWSKVVVPPQVNTLFGIEAIPGGGFWAVGSGTDNQGLILRKSGSQLTVVPGVPVADSGLLVDVAVISSTDAWTVGYQRVNGGFDPLVLGWDGSTWTSQPFSPSNGGDFEGIGATSTGRVWAGGLSNPPLYQACGV